MGVLPMAALMPLIMELFTAFAYIGLMSSLTLYLEERFTLSETNTIIMSHLFSALATSFPVLSAYLADNVLGRMTVTVFNIILFNVAFLFLVVGSIPRIPSFVCAGLTIFGMVLAALCTGTCRTVTPTFAAEQIPDEMSAKRESVFSLFYWLLNIGCVLTLCTGPVILTFIQCFDQSCYTALFGSHLLALMIGATLFMGTLSTEANQEYTENMVKKMFSCTWVAFRKKGKIPKSETLEDANCDLEPLLSSQKKDDRTGTFLDNAFPRYDRKFIKITHHLYTTVFLCSIVAIPFFSMYYQIFSTVPIQARKMDTQFYIFSIIPELILLWYPLVCVICVYLFRLVAYPLLEKCGLSVTSLRKMGFASVVTAISFVMVGIVQIWIDSSSSLPVVPEGKVLVFFTEQLPESSCKSKLLKANEVTEVQFEQLFFIDPGVYELDVCGNSTFKIPIYSSDENSGALIHVYEDDVNNTTTYKRWSFVNEKVMGRSVRILKTLPTKDLFIFYNETFFDEDPPKKVKIDMQVDMSTAVMGPSDRHLVMGDLYSNFVDTPMCPSLTFDINGMTSGTYAVVSNHKMDAIRLINILPPNRIHILHQLLPISLLAIAETLLVVSGQELCYDQAPPEMKSIIQSCWLIYALLGNVLTIALIGIPSPWNCFVFSAVMIVCTIIFIILARRFIYRKYDKEKSSVESVVPMERGNASKKEVISDADGEDDDSEKRLFAAIKKKSERNLSKEKCSERKSKILPPPFEATESGSGLTNLVKQSTEKKGNKGKAKKSTPKKDTTENSTEQLSRRTTMSKDSHESRELLTERTLSSKGQKEPTKDADRSIEAKEPSSQKSRTRRRGRVVVPDVEKTDRTGEDPETPMDENQAEKSKEPLSNSNTFGSTERSQRPGDRSKENRNDGESDPFKSEAL